MSVLVRHRVWLNAWAWSMRPKLFIQGRYHEAQPQTLRSCLQLNSRCFSATEYSPYPRHHRGRRVQNQGDAPRRSKDALTNAQESLENAAVAVTEADERLVKELGKTASFETYVKLMLSRLRPVLIYFVHHGPERFLKGYAPPSSSMARARDATLFLFISAHAWFFHAMAARSTRSLDFPPDIVKVAEQFAKSGNAVEAYVEDKLPEDMGWADVGGAIVDSSSNAWFAMSELIDRENGTASPDASKTDDPSTVSSEKGNDRT
ncbi:hypothetical protein JB92DRAFT_2870706 [Gautieria morchelliformis]|nr:hypothetical protein JB92DRAFT_2870706 [Gautieria morchelliformis]